MNIVSKNTSRVPKTKKESMLHLFTCLLDADVCGIKFAVIGWLWSSHLVLVSDKWYKKFAKMASKNASKVPQTIHDQISSKSIQKMTIINQPNLTLQFNSTIMNHPLTYRSNRNKWVCLAIRFYSLNKLLTFHSKIQMGILRF